jgi:hypothetical protein
MSFFNSIFGGGTQRTSQTLDPSSQMYVDRMRSLGTSGAGSMMNHPGQFFLGADPRSIQEQAQQFMNPYMDNVIGGVRGEFDFLRGQALQGANAQATQSGAFGGSRHGAMAGARMGELDRAQTSQIGGMMQSGWQNALQQGLQYSEYQRNLAERQAQEPVWRQQQAMQHMNAGMGPVGWNTETQMPGNPLGTLMGLGTTLAGGGAFGALGGLLGGGKTQQPTPGFGATPSWRGQPNFGLPQYQYNWMGGPR